MAEKDDILSSVAKENTQTVNEEAEAALNHSIPIKPAEEGTGPQPEEDTDAGKAKRKYKSRGRKAKQARKVNTELVESEVEKMMQEMEAAYLADLENNQIGKPALNKLTILNKVVLKLRSEAFAEVFLDKNGLEQFHNFLKRLPDGSWPLSSIRKQIYETLANLPCTEHHLKYTKLGKTLTLLQKSKSEYDTNKKLIQVIKDKWSRIVCGISMNYSNLENSEKENYRLMKKKRKRMASKNFGSSYIDGKLTQNISTRKVKMGYNFTIRPESELGKRDFNKNAQSSAQMERFLANIRKRNKRL